MNKNPILITGAHRSGTTWVGKTLADSPHVAYIHEPFNLKQSPGICPAPIEYWYTYINERNSQNFFHAVKGTLEFKYSLKAELYSIQRIKDFARMIRDLCVFTYYRYGDKPRPLIKDPFALFSVEWFQEKFNTCNVILIRHPAAYVSSILKKGWSFPFEGWAKQEGLMNDLLTPYKNEIFEFTQQEKPLIDQAILLWKAAHHVINTYQEQYPDWHFIRHEDLCRDPVGRFSKLFDDLQIPWEPKIGENIREKTNQENPINPPDASVFDINRDSKATIYVWKQRLNASQVDYIRQQTQDISDQFYTEKDW